MNTSIEFTFNGRHSSEFGVWRVHLDNGLVTEDNFLGNKEVNSFKTRSSIRSYLTHINKEPLVIPMVLYFEENLNNENEREVKKWLETDEFCELQFDDDEFIYYAIVNGTPSLTHNAIDCGHLEIEFLTNSPYRFGKQRETKRYHSTSDTEYMYLDDIINYGDLMCYPTFEIIAPNDINYLEIYNETTEQKFILDGNFKDLSLYVFNELEELHSEAWFPTLYDAHNDKFISFNTGKNKIKIKGKCYFKMTYQPIYF
ncbi:hypothetical protein ACFVRU_23320 [Streptomyces sp. NPDC057927]